MRRKDREIKELSNILAVMKRCDACRLALNDTDGYPYVIALNFAVTEADGKVTLYFHSAAEGKKLDLLRRDNRAAFEMNTDHVLKYFPERGYCTMNYESVCGRGRLRMVEESEKAHVLQLIMNHFHETEDAYYNPAAIPRTAVYALDVEEITGKCKDTKG